MHLFFYGTLMAGNGGAAAQAAHRVLGPGLPARTPGALHAIPDPEGWYPALVDGEGWVCGMVHAATSGFGQNHLAALDAYEGAEYVRMTITVTTRGGRVEAETYLYAAPLPASAVLLPHGDFARFLAETGATPFGAPPPPR